MVLNIPMLTKLEYSVPIDLLKEAANNLPSDDFRFIINNPTGDFFYDPWEIKEDFKDTVWDKILKTLPFDIGEARIITLKYGNCYQSHGDIDDRYHLNISAHYSYLVNLDTDTMYKLLTDGIWYEMDASPRHSAVNFGYHNRIQLVVRKLLNRNQLKSPVKINIHYAGNNIDVVRFTFDDILSPWLNRANKDGIINNFKYKDNKVYFDIDEYAIKDLENVLPKDFVVEVL